MVRLEPAPGPVYGQGMTAPPVRQPAPRLVYVVTEDWFFCSHFLPMARAARGAGFDVAVICRVRQHGERLAAEGLRVLPLDGARRSLSPLTALRQVSALVQLLRQEQPDVVHLIALKMLLLGGLAARLAGVRGRVFAVTGMGFLAAAAGWRAQAVRRATITAVRLLAGGTGGHFLFENTHDAKAFGLQAEDSRVSILGGAGVDPARFPAAPLPPVPPLRLAMVARMLWSKGADVAVAAVAAARAAGHDVTLTLVGAPDPENPRSFTPADLEAFGQQPGIHWRGAVEQAAVPALWREHHAALLPSRGGEGLPRSLLEAAACGRAIITTAVPGCGDFVRGGTEGLVVPPDDAAALAEAIGALAADPARVAAMGEAARQRVLAGYTEEAVGAATLAVYRRLLP
jgi:glycosyltransferase involved in cell wall biosynthesis